MREGREGGSGGSVERVERVHGCVCSRSAIGERSCWARSGSTRWPRGAPCRRDTTIRYIGSSSISAFDAHRRRPEPAGHRCARITMRRGPTDLLPGDQRLGCLGALAVRDVWRAESAATANGVGAVPRHVSSCDGGAVCAVTAFGADQRSRSYMWVERLG